MKASRSPWMWAAGLWCSTLWAPLCAQHALPPWIGGLPGLEHPAAWGLQEGGIAFGAQHASQWSQGAEPLNHQWLGFSWSPSPAARGWSGGGLGRWTFGTRHHTAARATGWTEGRHALQAAVRIPLDGDWTGAAGIGLGARTWVLDGRSWSWDSQYGPGGYDPTASTGEPDGRVVGAGWSPVLTLGVAGEYRPRRAKAAQLKGAVTLQHVLPPTAPHFQDTPVDTLSRAAGWWMEVRQDLGSGGFTWTAWHRGAWQQPAAIAEFGGTLERTFGNASLHTRETLGHRIGLGVIWRTDGLFRLPFTWRHGDLRLWLAPGVDIGHRSPAADGWALGLTWQPALSGNTPIGSR